MLAGGLLIFFFILPTSYISKGAGTSFGVIIEPRLYLERFAERRTLLNESCGNVNATLIPSPKTLLYSKQLGLVYCPVPLIGSTSIKHALLLAENKTLRMGKLYHLPILQSIHSQAQELNLHDSALKNPSMASKLSSSGLTLLMIVRNPWRRLVSFYKDIVEGSWAPTFTKCTQFVNREEGLLTFQGFLNCIVFYANGTTSLKPLDVRLSPASYSCSACRVPYNTISKSHSQMNLQNIHFYGIVSIGLHSQKY